MVPKFFVHGRPQVDASELSFNFYNVQLLRFRLGFYMIEPDLDYQRRGKPTSTKLPTSSWIRMVSLASTMLSPTPITLCPLRFLCRQEPEDSPIIHSRSLTTVWCFNIKFATWHERAWSLTPSDFSALLMWCSIRFGSREFSRDAKTLCHAPEQF